MWIVGKQWITSVNRTKCMIKLVLIHFKLRLSFLGRAVLEMKVLFCDNWWLWFQFCCVAGWAILEEFMQSCFSIKVSFWWSLPRIEIPCVLQETSPGAGLWGHSVVTLCTINWDWSSGIQVLIKKLQDVHTSETSNPLLVCCGGASWIFREGGVSWWHREQQGHTRGTVPPQVPLGAAWTFLSQFHGASMEFLPLALSWTSSSRSGAWCPPRTLSLILGTFCDFSGAEEWFPSSPSIAWPSCVIAMGLLAFLVGLCWSLECNYCSCVGDSIPWSSECFANSNIWAVCLNWMKVLHKC